jgi:hypothetical protein
MTDSITEELRKNAVVYRFREFCESCDRANRRARHEASREYVWEEYRYDIGSFDDKEDAVNGNVYDD